jgi:hypothetical protein
MGKGLALVHSWMKNVCIRKPITFIVDVFDTTYLDLDGVPLAPCSAERRKSKQEGILAA